MASKYFKVPAGGTSRFDPDHGIIEHVSMATYGNVKNLYHCREIRDKGLVKEQLKSQAAQYEIDWRQFEDDRHRAEQMWAERMQKINHVEVNKEDQVKVTLMLEVFEAWRNTQSLSIATCGHCANKYFDGSGKSKYCSNKCRVAAHKKRRSK